MATYIFKRLALTALSLLILLTLLFFLLQLIPGYPLEKAANETDSSYYTRLDAVGLLDDPFTQFARFWQGLFVRGEFGVKYNDTKLNVVQTFTVPMQYTLMIAMPAFVIAAFLGITLGIISAYNRGKWQDTTVNILAVIFAAVPSFVLALYLLQFAGALGLPLTFIEPGKTGTTLGDSIASIVIPVLAMVLSSISVTVYFTRNELVEVFKQEYIKTALAKGMPFISVLFKHALRNASIPVLFSLLPNLIVILSGSFIIEKFFNVPGSASVVINSIQTKEIYVVLFAGVFFSGIYFLLQIAFDAISTIIDPRIKLTQTSNKSVVKLIQSKFIRNKDTGSEYIQNLNAIKNYQEEEIYVGDQLNLNKNINLIPINPDKTAVQFNATKVNYGIDLRAFKLDDPSKRIYIDSSGKPSTRWHDVSKRFFKDKAAIIFVIVLSLIILSSVIFPLVYQAGPNNTLTPGVKNLSSFLPPRIPFLGLSGSMTKTMSMAELTAWQNAGITNIFELAGDPIAPDQYLVTFNPYEANALQSYYPILGTGPLGEDWNNKLWYATAQSLLFATIVAAISTFIGAIYGAIAGFNAGKTVDTLMMRFVEILSGVPTIVWIIIFSLVFSGGVLSMPIIGVSLVIISWIWPAITTRVFVLKYKDADYIEASKTLGASNSRLIFVHLIPNISGKLMVRFVNQIPRIIFFETSLIFLGLKSATDVNLGTMIDVARTTNYFYLLFGPTAIIVLITLSAQIIANAFNDALDPRVSGGR